MKCNTYERCVYYITLYFGQHNFILYLLYFLLCYNAIIKE